MTCPYNPSANHHISVELDKHSNLCVLLKATTAGYIKQIDLNSRGFLQLWNLPDMCSLKHSIRH